MRKTSSLLGICLLACLMTVFIGGCVSNQNSTEGDSSSYPLNKLTSDLYENGNYIFEGQKWLTAKPEIAKTNNQDEVQKGDQQDRIITKGEFALTENVEQFIIYNFEDDKLVSGEYVFSTADKETFLSVAKELQASLSSLQAPISNDLSVLDTADSAAAQGQHIMWEGEDQSNLRLNVLTSMDEGEKLYLLQVQSSSPLPQRKTLNP